MKKTFRFGNSDVDFYFEEDFSSLGKIADPDKTILLTDENLNQLYAEKFQSWKTITIKSGEDQKVQATADHVVRQLMDLQADRSFLLVGVGGGVITDLAGYVASIYMRGISFGFVPTSLLAMVDASIGGKNGVDVGMYKNMVGTIRQPSFILYDPHFLQTLPDHEWRNGFAEVIKHASIKDSSLFKELEQNNLSDYRKMKKEGLQLIRKNALIKIKVVQQDENENGDRRLLNFGHTLGHAIENQYGLSHGEAISIGMVKASLISHQLTGFKKTERLVHLLEKYGLPTSFTFDKEKVIRVLQMDKKKVNHGINFILLKKIGKAVIQEISIEQLYTNI